MNAPVRRAIVWVSLALGVLPAWAKDPHVVYYACKVKPAGEYLIRVDRIAEVMWVNGTRLKLDRVEQEYRATEYSGEPNELKAEYRINRASGVLRRISHGLKGALRVQEGVCKPSEKPAPTNPLY
jgi:hypothetical protein